MAGNKCLLADEFADTSDCGLAVSVVRFVAIPGAERAKRRVGVPTQRSTRQIEQI